MLFALHPINRYGEDAMVADAGRPSQFPASTRNQRGLSIAFAARRWRTHAPASRPYGETQADVVTVTIMLPAPPAPHLGARPLPATPDAACGRCRRYRAMAIGFGGMTATKALKHFQINLTDVLVFLSRLTAQATGSAS